MKGIDVSNWNRYFNFGRYDGDFAMIKASQGKSDYGSYQGDNIMDSSFRRNAQAATTAGVPWGAYHYLTAQNTMEAHAEAEFFWSVIEPYRDNIRLWAAVDVESPRWLPNARETLTQIVKVFTDTVAARGFKPMVYTNPSFLVYRFSRPENVPLWLAYWNTSERKAKQYDPLIWQYGLDEKYGVDGNIGYFALPDVLGTASDKPVYAVGDEFTIPKGARYTNGIAVPERLIGKVYEIGKVKDGAVYLPRLWSWIKV